MHIREGTVELKFRDTMDYGIYALTSGYVKEGALEATRLAIVRAAKTKDIIQITADTPITKKPEGIRMGKGKGKTAYHAAKVKAGRWLFEFNCEDDMFAKEAWRQANFKLPLRIYLRKRPKEPRRVLTIEELEQMIKEDKNNNSS
ncbi:large ribosomal subunit protein uL16-like [Rhopilema esculentum]|uniref:large ribosomal subunit protein uL16-like n=1 Tax=Rhopilema esculentum TaxID=499914 RepID=UPI0031DE193E